MQILLKKRIMIPRKKAGIKLYIGVDILGLLHAIRITKTNVGNREGAIGMIDFYCNISNHFSILKKVLADRGYTGKSFANKILFLRGAEVEIVKRNKISSFVVLPKCWVVKRSLGWLDKYRRLWKNCECKLQNSFHMAILAFVRLRLTKMINRL